MPLHQKGWSKVFNMIANVHFFCIYGSSNNKTLFKLNAKLKMADALITFGSKVLFYKIRWLPTWVRLDKDQVLSKGFKDRPLNFFYYLKLLRIFDELAVKNKSVQNFYVIWINGIQCNVSVLFQVLFNFNTE